MYTKVIINQTKCPNARTVQRKCFVSWIVQLRLSIDARPSSPKRGKPRFWWNRGFVKYGKRMSARQIRSPGIPGQCPMHAMVKRHHRTACEWAFYQRFVGRTIYHQNQVIGCSADIIGIGGWAIQLNLPGMLSIPHAMTSSSLPCKIIVKSFYRLHTYKRISEGKWVMFKQKNSWKYLFPCNSSFFDFSIAWNMAQLCIKIPQLWIENVQMMCYNDSMPKEGIAATENKQTQ